MADRPADHPGELARALEIVRKTAADNDFRKFEVFYDNPGDRIVWFYGTPYLASLDFRSTPTESVLGVVTGCHPVTGEPLT